MVHLEQELIVTISKATFLSSMQLVVRYGITLEIDVLTKQLEQLSKEYNVTEDEVKTYQTAVEKVQQLTTLIKASKLGNAFL